MPLVLGLLLVPLKAEAVPTKIEIQQEPYLIATHPVEIEETIEYKTPQHTVIKAVPSIYGRNCVEYARSKSSLPNGLGTLAQKKSHIISRKFEAGKIGVTPEGSVGHLVVIEKVNAETLVISEGNYRHGYVTWREIPKSLVLGVF